MNIQIRQITEQDDEVIKHIISFVGQEFGAIGEGFGPSDDEVNAMSQHYLVENSSCYFVALLDGVVVGGCGIAPFADVNDTCELKKLFLLPQSRGLGIGRALTEKCLEFAKNEGYESCYLDTLRSMSKAIDLYKAFGFKQLSQPLVGTIHQACDIWMMKSL